ncbi:MAG: hypothetical protein MUE41_05535 [Gemmatimonadaceae bacterium]|jgi:hypothetical protein|nr:hypothetical protein [Gemmatimonadaceae bacterium]
MSDTHDDVLPAWVAEALRQPVTRSPASRERIMTAVRGGPAPAVTLKPVATRWARRGILSVLGATLAMGALAVTFVLPRVDRAPSVAFLPPVVRVLGDSVVPVAHAVAGGSFLDTLHVVEVVLRGAAIRSAAVLLGRHTVEMECAEDSAWRVRMLAPRDRLPSAVVVNASRVVPIDPGAVMVDSL